MVSKGLQFSCEKVTSLFHVSGASGRPSPPAALSTRFWPPGQNETPKSCSKSHLLSLQQMTFVLSARPVCLRGKSKAAMAVCARAALLLGRYLSAGTHAGGRLVLPLMCIRRGFLALKAQIGLKTALLRLAAGKIPAVVQLRPLGVKALPGRNFIVVVGAEIAHRPAGQCL